MASLTYNTENKRIRTANSNSVATIPSEDSENERILILSDSTTTPPVDNDVKFIDSGDGFFTIEGKTITDEYLDPSELGLVVNEDGYIPLEV
mgnify:CR=1 FL=1